MINSVLGPISANDLGKTLIHEHITFGLAGWYANEAITPFDRGECVEASFKTMAELKTYGINTFVDATPNDSGRDPGLLREISELSGMNIICSTGLYTDAEGGSPYFKFRAIHGDVEFEIYELFLKELTQGIGSTGIKAGVIKVATGERQISTYEKSVLKAAGRVQKETSVPIITHTVAGSMGPEQADILISEGADPKRIVIGHICSSADMKYHLTVLEKGVYIAFDRLGIESAQSDTVRKACIIGLVGIGYADKIMLSNDSIGRWLGKPFVCKTPTHVFKNIIPDLKKGGVTDDQINMMMVENPRRLFTGAK